MPELPDVEGYRRYLARHAEGQRIARVDVPDPADVDRNLFDELLDPRRGAIKAALMDQRLVAGVGNLMSDEILWRARVHPSSPVRKLGSRARGRLYDALHAVVGESVRYGRVP